MKQFEFETQLGPDATIRIPTQYVDRIAAGQPIRVVVLLPDADQDRAWADATAAQFLQGYADSDAIYDDLSAG